MRGQTHHIATAKIDGRYHPSGQFLRIRQAALNLRLFECALIVFLKNLSDSIQDILGWFSRSHHFSKEWLVQVLSIGDGNKHRSKFSLVGVQSSWLFEELSLTL
jgi:hypothetical protein